MTEFLFIVINYINDLISDHYFYTIFGYFIFSICFFSLSLPGGLIILIGSGFFFGFYIGFIINLFSISLGSLFFIYFSKTFLNKIFNKYYLKFSDKVSNYVKNSSFEYLILLRLIIGPPLVFQNLCISILNINILKIFVTTIIGFSPQMLLFAYIGSYSSSLVKLKSYTLLQIFSLDILIIFGILIFLILLRIIFKKV